MVTFCIKQVSTRKQFWRLWNEKLSHNLQGTFSLIIIVWEVQIYKIYKKKLKNLNFTFWIYLYNFNLQNKSESWNDENNEGHPCDFFSGVTFVSWTSFAVQVIKTIIVGVCRNPTYCGGNGAAANGCGWETTSGDVFFSIFAWQ